MHNLIWYSRAEYDKLAPAFKKLHSGKGGKGCEGSIYKVIEVVGTSKNSWEEAARNAVEIAAQSLEDLRVAEGIKQDMTIDKNKVTYFRARVNLFSKYHPED